MATREEITKRLRIDAVLIEYARAVSEVGEEELLTHSVMRKEWGILLEKTKQDLSDLGVVRKVEDDSDPIVNMDIYPKSVVGGKHPYEERNDYQNGWNAALMELTKKMAESGIEYVAIKPLIGDDNG